MDALKKGQLIAAIGLVITIVIVVRLPARMTGPKDLAILALVICAITVVLLSVFPIRDRRVQEFVLFLSISIACLETGLLLLKAMFAAGVFLIGISFLPGGFAIRLLVRKVRKRNAP
jgi:uncharacterized membrane protein